MGFHQPITKYSPPHIGGEYVVRSSLSAKIERVFKTKNIYLHAPLGYGKTLAVTRWLKNREHHVAWLALDKYDDNPQAFYKEFLLALIADTTDRRERSALLRDPGLIQYPLSYLLKILPDYVAQKKIEGMIIEGLHYVTNSEILGALPLIQKKLAPSFHFIFLSEEDPPEEFSFWEKKEFYILGKEDLVFSADDVEKLLCKYDKAGNLSLSREVYKESGGWPLGANILLHSHYKGEKAVEEVKGRGDVFTYYETTIDSLMSPRGRDFLLRVSLVDNISQGFCKTLAGNLDYASLLDSLTQMPGMVYKMDRGWKLHRLFQEYLVDELKKKDQEFIDWGLQRAFNYYRNRRQPFAASELAMLLGDMNLLAKLLKETSKFGKKTTSIEEEVNSINAFISERLTHEETLRIDHLIFEAAWFDFLKGNISGMGQWLEIINQKYQRGEIKNSDEILSRFLLNTVSPHSTLEYLLGNLVKVQRENPVVPGSYVSRYSLTMNLPFFHRSLRDFSEMFIGVDPQEVFDRLKMTGDPMFRTFADLIQGGFLLETFDLDEALKVALRAYDSACEFDIPEIMFSGAALLAEIYYGKNQGESARKVMKHLKSGLSKNEGMFLYDNIYAYEARRQLYDGDEAVASQWFSQVVYLRENGRSFYKLYQNLTTARMLIKRGEVDEAIVFLKAIEKLSRSYRRKLNIIESDVLLAKCYWYKGEAKEALRTMEKAILLAQGQRIAYPFIIEGADVFPIMVRMMYNTKKTYPQVDREFLKFLKEKTTPVRSITESVELTGYLKNLKLSRKQKEMLRYLEEGKSYGEITHASGLSFGTVKVHIRTLYKRLMVRSAGEALARC